MQHIALIDRIRLQLQRLDAYAMQLESGLSANQSADLLTTVHPVNFQLARSRQHSRLLNAFQEALLDTLLILASFVLAWWLRYVLQLFWQVDNANYSGIPVFGGLFALLTVLILLVFKIQGLYDLPRSARWLDEVGKIVQGSLISIAAAIVLVFYVREFNYSRLMFFYSLIVIATVLSAERMILRLILGSLHTRGKRIERVLVVGAGTQGLHVMRSVIAQPELGYRIEGFVDDRQQANIARFPHLGKLDTIEQVLQRRCIEQVIIALPSASHEKILEIAALCQRLNILFRIVPDSYELSLSRVDINEIRGVPLLSFQSGKIIGWNRLVKRSVDLVCSLLILLAASPIMLATALLIKLDSAGPVFFRQVRVGENGHQFTIYKFRSMHTDAEQRLDALRNQNEATGPLFKMKRDPRCTRVGRIIRKLSIDELPQFFNILLGDMSLVGPRPPLPREVHQYQAWQKRRLEAPPGLTGLWQVSGRSRLTFDEMVLLDIYYIENWSLSHDFKIMLRTIPAVLFSHGAS